MPRLNMKKQVEDLGFTDVSILTQPGVYILGYNDEIVWVGKSSALGRRLGEHIGHNLTNNRNFAFDSIYILPVHLIDLDAVESFLILKLNPRYNVVSPHSLYHKVKGGLIGVYDQADKRRLNRMMGNLGLSYDDLATGFRDEEEKSA